MSAKRCAGCGHKASDHADGLMGASINGRAYCHTGHHSCYVAASRTLSPGEHFVTLHVHNPERPKSGGSAPR